MEVEVDPLSLEEKQFPELISINQNEITFSNTLPLKIKFSEIIPTNIIDYECSICGVCFKDTNDLNIHIETHKCKIYECFKCNEHFHELNDLLEHIKIYNINEIHSTKCLICGKTFKNKVSLNIHMGINHKGIKPYRCKYCVKMFTQLEKLQKHSIKHKKEEKGELTIYNKTKNIQIYKCSEFVNNFVTQIELDKHKSLTHKTESHELECKKCNEKFLKESNLQIHIKNVHEHETNQPFKCPLCEYSYDNLIKLNTHMLIHKDDENFECPDCADLFEDLQMFQTHMKIHDKILQNNEEIIVENISTNGNKITEEETANFLVIFSDFQNTNIPEINIIEESMQNLVAEETINITTEIEEYPFYDNDKMSSIQIDKNDIEINNKTIKDGIVLKKTDKPRKSRASSLAWQEKDNKFRPFKCNLCNRSFTLAGTLTLHNRRTHLNIKPYECKFCQWSFAQSSDLIKHTRKHTGERPYKCKFCNLGFTQNRNLKNHMKMHTEQPSICKYCNKSFAIDTSLVQHLKKHEGEIVILCKYCSIPFTYENDLKTHMKRYHKVEKPHKCSLCAKAFAKSCDLKKHSRIHTGEKPYECLICNKKFTHPTSLRNHSSVHSGIKSFQCSFCGQSFAFSGNLKVHIRMHTGERPFICDICNKAFARTANLNEHKKIHTGEKSHKCTICEKSFTNSSTFSKHKKIHSGIRPHKCIFCNKAFIQYAHLTKHIRIHTGERPYQCKICNKYFRRSDTLKSHNRTHNSTEEQQQPLQEQIHLDIIQSKIETETHSQVNYSIQNHTISFQTPFTITNL